MNRTRATRWLGRGRCRSWSGEAADALEQKVDEDDLTESAHHPAIRVIAAVYWPIVTAVFLAWGLIGNSWDVNWIIWPVAGVLFAAVSLIFNCKKTR